MLVCSSGWLYRGLSLGSFKELFTFSFSVLWSFVLKHHWFLFLSCCAVPFSPLAVAAWFDFSLRGVRNEDLGGLRLCQGWPGGCDGEHRALVPDCKLQVACGLPLSPDVDSEEQGGYPRFCLHFLGISLAVPRVLGSQCQSGVGQTPPSGKCPLPSAHCHTKQPPK